MVSMDSQGYSLGGFGDGRCCLLHFACTACLL